MRIITFLKFSLAFALVTGSLGTASAATAPKAKNKNATVPNFVAGNYSLTSSSKDAADICGDGEFKIAEGGLNILLGAKHGFLLSDKMEKTVATDDPDEKGCIYENSNSYSVKDDTTILSSREVLRCEGVERHSFLETAIITKERVHLEFKQVAGNSPNPGDAAAEYKCDWTLVKRSAASFMKAKALEKKQQQRK